MAEENRAPHERGKHGGSVYCPNGGKKCFESGFKGVKRGFLLERKGKSFQVQGLEEIELTLLVLPLSKVSF